MLGLDMIIPPEGSILQASDLGTSTVSVTIEDLYFFLYGSLGLSILPGVLGGSR